MQKLRICAPFQEFILPGVHDDQIRLEAQRFLDQRNDPIRSVRDAPCVDHLEISTRHGSCQEFPEPSRKGRSPVERMAVSCRTSEAENPECARLLFNREGNLIEILQLLNGS